MGFRSYLGVMSISFFLLMQGCGVYSFTGASIPPEAKTVSVQFFQNKAQLIEPTLSPLFTDALRDKFANQTNLILEDKNGDLALDGEIVEYRTTPVAIQEDQTAALNRLTISVNVRFVNKFEPDKDFESKFTQFIDYPSDADYNTVSGELIETINEMIATDIFNKAVINW